MQRRSGHSPAHIPGESLVRCTDPRRSKRNAALPHGRSNGSQDNAHHRYAKRRQTLPHVGERNASIGERQ